MQLEILKIRTDGGTQPRSQLDFFTIDDYADAMANGATFPPIEVIYDGSNYWLVDGFHRVNVARQLGLAEIFANVTAGTLQDAQWISYGVNQSHGLRRSNDDKRRAVESALNHPKAQQLSDREIARHCGVDHKTVSAKRNEMNLSGEIPQIETRTATRNGSTYQMNTAAIGKTSNGNASPQISFEQRQVLRHTDIAEDKKQIEKLAKIDPELQSAIIEKIVSGTASTVTEAARQINHESKREAAPIAGKYRIFYADPPWAYGDTRTGLEGYSAAVDHYPAMSIEELCALPVKQAAEDNAVLFLWVTSPLLEECFAVIKAWGFQYKTSFVWDKVRHNVGHYNSVRHELLLICTRGSCTPDNVKLFDSVQTIERTDKHSQKPAEFREIIETLYTSGNKIELFCREPAPGWDVWGNEC